ncbi:BZ3500_MvSof-1268-A1-R1_Chr5-2g07944 [Microbotryum saponariae]|uniref:BZ3500_MvSof-1268-A1-R1_Chr5-2g07944 protein n=1 Tax=Microbotryum saponariae TaxID=289078 RepID=A0A2X0KMN3_9BASI|nr:BZ3500_MvSof-1268-A1-R1_Chr5-2g07944 [Microbotryum saponariae]SDA05813.1 BZ3501_MvSof-1269-A2-R1_Chr5-2g07766 [Microbotryum saponariae]
MRAVSGLWATSHRTKECWTHTDLYPFGDNADNMYTAEASWVHYVPGVCASYTALAGSIGSGCYQYQVVAATTTTSSTTAPQTTTGPSSALSTAASSSSTSSSSASFSTAASSSSASSSSTSSASASSSSSSSTSSSSSSAASSTASSPTSSPSMTTTPQSSTRSPSASSTSTSSTSSATTTTTGLSRAQPSNVNIARLPGVTATASSFRASSPPSGANDGIIGGLELDGSGNAAQEWSTGTGTVPAWIQLTWPQSYLIKTVVLFPPVNLLNAIRAGTLTFSDGSTANVGVLSPFGTQINLGAGKTTSSLRFTITGAAVARNGVGISEMRAYNAAPAVGGVLGGTTGVV